MKKELTNQTNSELTDDSEMLDEYDFSQGVRGKYFQKYQNNNLTPLAGIQFLTDSQGRKTGVIIDLQKYSNLWSDITEEYGYPSKCQFLVDEQGHRNAVFLDFKEHLKIWEHIYDRLIADLIA